MQGTVGENNRYLRRQIIDARKKRDAFMMARFDVLSPFLPYKNYFQRKEKKEKEIESPDQTLSSAAPEVFVSAGSSSSSNSSSAAVDAGVVEVGAIPTTVVDNIDTMVPNTTAAVNIAATTTLGNAIAIEGGPVAESVPGVEAIDDDDIITSNEQEQDQIRALTSAANDAFVLRGIELVQQAPTLIAELHQHQVGSR